MNIYFDLGFVSHLILSFISGYFLNNISVNKLKGRGILKLSLFSSLIIVLVYFEWWLALLIIILLHVLAFFLFFKKKFLEPCFTYLCCYYANAFFMSLFTEKVSVYKFVFIIKEPKGMFVLLLAPLFIVVLNLVTKAVDSIYHLGNYKVDIILSVDNQKARFKSYFDTGNTLKYRGVPVIFCIKDAWPFKTFNIIGKATFKTIENNTEMALTEALIYLKENEKTLVYVALVDNNKGFNGCECLLNAYLG